MYRVVHNVYLQVPPKHKTLLTITTTEVTLKSLNLWPFVCILHFTKDKIARLNSKFWYL